MSEELYNVLMFKDVNGKVKSILIENEEYVILNNKLLLNYIPDKNNKVIINGMYEVKQGQRITDNTQFKVNYSNGEITFHADKNETTVVVTKYFGIGVIRIYADRVIDNMGDSIDTSKSLQDYIDSVKPYGYKGDYNPATTYEPSSIVAYDYGIYRCKQTTKGILPTNTDYWEVMFTVKSEAEYAKAQGDYAKASADSILLISEDFTPETITVNNDIAPLVKNELNRIDSSLADIVKDVRDFGAKCDGVTDDTAALLSALKSNYKNIKMSGTMLITTGNLLIDSGVDKKFYGENEAIIKCDFNAGKNLFDFRINVELVNMTFDFNNKYVVFGVKYPVNVGTVKLTDLVFKNVRDMDTTYGTTLVYVQDSILYADKIKFDTIRKKPNGTIGDSGGNVTGLMYQNINGLQGSIKNITVNEMHNINDADVIQFEDASGIFVSSTVDTKKAFLIENITGYNYGKRLIKTQASNLSINNVVAHSTIDDVLVAIGIQDLNVEGDTSINIKNVRVSNFTITGKAQMGISASINGVTFDKGYIDITGVAMTGNTSKSYGLYFTGSNLKFKNVYCSSERSVFINNHAVVSLANVSAKDILIENCIFDVKSTGDNGIYSQSTTCKGILNFTLKNVKIINNFPVTNGTYTIDIYSNTLSKNVTFDNIEIELTSIADGYGYGICIRKASNLKMRNIRIKSANAKGIYENCKIDTCDNVDIAEMFLDNQDSSNACRYINLNVCTNVLIKSLKGSLYRYSVIMTNCTTVSLESVDFSKLVNTTSTGVSYIRGTNSGTTANRPTPLIIGEIFFDTTLGKPIFCKQITPSVVWVDSTGTAV